MFAAKLLPALQERGYEFIVVTQQSSPDLPEEGQFKGIPVYRLPFYTPLVGGNIAPLVAIRQQVAKLKRGFAPDLIHTNNLGGSILFHLDTTKSYPAPWLLTLHGIIYKLLVERDSRLFSTPHQGKYEHVIKGETVFHKALRTANWITCVSETLLAETRRFEPEITSCSSVIYNGLEESSLHPTPLPFNPPWLLCLGRLAPYKGFDLALTALVSILERFPHIRLTIAGDGPSRSDLERLTVELGLTHAVDFVGWIAPDQVPALINNATVVVMPSWGEGLPLVALEAALMARPVVATRVAGLSEVVKHQQTGLLTEEYDSGGLAQAIASLLEHPDRATRMGQAARSRVKNVFSFERCVAAYDALYQQLTSRQK